MAKKQKKKKGKKSSQPEVVQPKDFLELIAPGAVRFNTDSYVLGNSFRCAIALRRYPTVTEELALFRHLGEKSGLTLHIYARRVTSAEEDGILHNAANKNRLAQSNTNDMKQSIAAEENLHDVTSATQRISVPV